MPLPIRHHLALWYTSLVCLTFLVTAGGIYLSLRAAVSRNADRELGIRLQGIQVFLTREASLDPPGLANELSSHAGVRLNGDLYQLSDPSGDWIYRPPSVEPLAIPFDDPATLNSPRIVQIERNGMRYRILSAMVSSGPNRYEVQLVSNITPITNVIRNFLWASLMAAPFIFSVAWFSGIWMSGRAVEPVRAIITAAQGIREINLNERLPVSPAHDELRDLALTMNSMLERIERAFRKITQFTADASHELRTPIAVIRTTAEVALEQHREAAEYTEYLHQVLAESVTATELLEDMLTLARKDAKVQDRGIVDVVDLRPIILGVEPAFARITEAKGLMFRCDVVNEPLLLKGDRQSLRRLLLILIDNAIKFTSPGGSVSVIARCGYDGIVLKFRDTGFGIDPEDLPHIFERFYRSGHGRSRETGGAGLGLAIAQAIAGDHNATIQVESRVNEGSTFTVSFPNQLFLTTNEQPSESSLDLSAH
jgi:signal transduction histidine kinase